MPAGDEMPTSARAKIFIINNWPYILLAVVVIAIIIISIVLSEEGFENKSTYVNRGSSGYNYETDNLSFISADDRNIAINALIKTLGASGVSYKASQFSEIPASFIITMNESDNDTEFALMAAKLVILIDPMYKSAYAAVSAATRAGNKLAGDGSRQIIYDMLVKYFLSLKTPIGNPLSEWSDILLIRTFKTLRLPPKTDFSVYPNTSAPDTVASIPAGVTTITPVVPISVPSV